MYTFKKLLCVLEYILMCFEVDLQGTASEWDHISCDFTTLVKWLNESFDVNEIPNPNFNPNPNPNSDNNPCAVNYVLGTSKTRTTWMASDQSRKFWT